MVSADSRPFPTTLLEQTPVERLSYFQRITVPHQKLRVALATLLMNIESPIDLSVFFVVGPAGVGKTTLRRRAERLLLESVLPTMLHSPSQLPVAGIEAVPAEKGTFSYKDYYLRVLEALNPLQSQAKMVGDDMESQVNKAPYYYPGFQGKQPETLRRILEQAMKRYQLKAFMIDEAQHLVLVAGGKQMLHQMDWLKSIANLSETIHVLFGTYDLLNCCTLSGQVSRRSDDIHLARYLPEQSEDLEEFRRVIQTFQEHLPLLEEPNLMQYQDYLLEYSIGCVGILNTWLTKALRMALAEDAKTLHLQHLQQNEYSSARRKQIRQEAESGEKRWQKQMTQGRVTKPELADSANLAHPPASLRPGQRQAKRDPVGATPHAS
ncbi:AAA family ATPase [Pantanalinema rosaneae CENA516]|uniref:AAA family ATPase n=1 Tax=Pantanalinema rosaneae TaxID=1620701 RepID=UPI003D6E6BDE